MAVINKIFCATDRDGGLDGNMDSIAYLFLNDNDMCMVVESASNTVYFYRYESSNAEEDDGLQVIIPDDNTTGTGAWILQSATFEDITIVDDIIQVADDLTVIGQMNIDTIQTYTASGDLTLNNQGGSKIIAFEDGQTISLAAGGSIGEFSIDGTMAGNSDSAVPTEQAVVEYAGTAVAHPSTDGSSHTFIDQNVTSTGTPTFNTVDANTDFTVGSLVITDGIITDATGLQLAAAVAVTGALTVDSISARSTDTNLTLAANGTGVIDINDSWNAAGQTCSDLGTITTANIDGGTIDGTSIGVSAQSSIQGTTIDATTDFTIGSTVITDGIITDATGLDLAASVTANDLTLDSCGIMQTGSTPSGTSAMEYNGYLYATRVYNPVYADLAEMWQVDKKFGLQKFEPGNVLAMGDNGMLRPIKQTGEKATAGVVSNTYGFCLGTQEGVDQRPIALAGKVLAKVDQVYTPGTELWASGQKQGYLVAMTKKELKNNPTRVVAKYLYKEPEKQWGVTGSKVLVNDRHWVKVI